MKHDEWTSRGAARNVGKINLAKQMPGKGNRDALPRLLSSIGVKEKVTTIHPGSMHTRFTMAFKQFITIKYEVQGTHLYHITTMPALHTARPVEIFGNFARYVNNVLTAGPSFKSPWP